MKEDNSKLREIGADHLRQLLDKANIIGITKKQFIEIIEVEGQLHLIYVD